MPPQPPKNTPQGDLATKERAATKKPRRYRVLLHNDDYTTMDFVVLVLVKIFRKSETEATQIMLTVHHKGVGVCGVFPFEVAEAKVVQVTEFAKAHGYPLKCSLEPESAE